MRKAYIVKGYVHDVENGTMNDVSDRVYTTLDKAKRAIRRMDARNEAVERAVLEDKNPYEIYYRLHWEDIYIY